MARRLATRWRLRHPPIRCYVETSSSYFFFRVSRISPLILDSLANDKSDTSIVTDASETGCACGTQGNFPDCTPLTCDLVCNDGVTGMDKVNGCANTLDTEHFTDGDSTDPHHLGRSQKVCRWNNDASCHSCPSTSCQYPVGNFWGSGFPCKNLEGKLTQYSW